MKHTVEPIKNKNDVKRIENYLKNNVRDRIIWLIGITSGLRVSDILGLDVAEVKNKNTIKILEKKTGKYKEFPIHNKVASLLSDFIKDRKLNEPLFLGKQGRRLDRREVYRFINHACKELGIDVNVGTHTMRKTFGYHHYKQFKDIVILQKIFNHSSQSITLRYIGVAQDEINESYKKFSLIDDEECDYIDKLENTYLLNRCFELERKMKANPIKDKEERKVITMLENYLANGGIKYRNFVEHLLSSVGAA